MEFLLSIYFVTLFVSVVGVMAYRVSRGAPLLSLLHFFLAGLLIFQISSGAIMLGLRAYGETNVQEPATTGVWYALMVTTFLIIFAVGWKTKALTFGLQNRIGTSQAVPTSATMMALAWGVLGAAVLFRFVLAFVPVFSQLSLIIASALASASVGLAAWAWARHWGNPTFVVLFGSLLLCAIAIVIFQNFGRRDVASVLIAALWGAFHGHFKLISIRRAVLPFAAIATFGLVTLAAFTSARTEKAAETSFVETITRLFSADIVRGLLDMGAGQEAAGYSMYLIETRPEATPYDPLHSMIYAVVSPVPRQFWEGKPNPLGLMMVPEMGITKKSAGYNVGPGLIGHIVNDNPYICLWLYPLVLAALLRIGDDLVRKFAENPFIVVPLGVALAEITALSRGELGLFLFRAVTATLSAYVFMWVTAKILVALGMRYQAVLTDVAHVEDDAVMQEQSELIDPTYAYTYGQDENGHTSQL